jgi:hypothetical protein
MKPETENTSSSAAQKKSSNADPAREDVKKSGLSASEKASEQAKKGEPLTADNPRDRSPKQENL